MNKKYHPIRNFFFALSGIRNVLSSEMNSIIIIFIGLFVCVAGWFFHINRMEWVAVVMCTGAVFMMELVNTSIEKMVDKLWPEHNEMAGRIKDISAGAVLIASLFSAIVGLIIFLPKVIDFFQATT